MTKTIYRRLRVLASRALCALVFLHLPGFLRAQAPASVLYLVAATPGAQLITPFPATLLRVGPDGLARVRPLAPGDAGVDFVLPDNENIVLGYPKNAPSHVSIVHFSDPAFEDVVDLGISTPDIVSAEIVHREGLPPALALDRYPGSDPSGELLLGVDLIPLDRPRMVMSLDWTSLADTWYEGEPAIPFPGLGPAYLNLSAGGLGHYVPAWGRFLPLRGKFAPGAGVLQVAISGDSREPATLRAANGRFIIATSGNSTFVVNESSGEVRLLDPYLALTGTLSRLRLFGSWLAITGASANVDHKVQPGTSNMRSVRRADVVPAAARKPGVAELFKESGLYFPGIISLLNLDSGVDIVMRTGQADSEVIRVDGNTVLYRINRTLYSAEIEGGKLGPASALAESDDIPEVHWAFWSAE